MLIKIKAIQNIGRFQCEAFPGDVSFGELTLIYANNGQGKSTLCDIFRSMSTGDNAHIEGRKTLGSLEKPKVQIQFSDRLVTYKQGRWSETVEDVDVYDEAFINENVHAGSGIDVAHRRNLCGVLIGRDVILSQQKIDRLKKISEKLDIIISKRKLKILAHIDDKYPFDAFLKLPSVENIDLKIDETNKTLKILLQKDSIKATASPETIPTPAIPSETFHLLKKTIHGIIVDAQDCLQKHLDRFEMDENGQAWLHEGMAWTKKEGCPFCGQEYKDRTIIDAISSVFNTAYEKLKSDLISLNSSLNASLGELALSNIIAKTKSNNLLLDFWSTHGISYEKLEIDESANSLLTNLKTLLAKYVQKKIGAPVEPIKIVDDPEFVSTIAGYAKFVRILSTYNKSIFDANVKITALKATAQSTNSQTVQQLLAKLEATKKRHSPTASILCNLYEIATKKKKETNVKRTIANDELKRIGKEVMKNHESRINAHLTKFGTGFRITQADASMTGREFNASFMIEICGVAILPGSLQASKREPCLKNTLSAGDKSALALAFFLSMLESYDDISNKIIVFDDPFTSQDAFRRQRTVEEIFDIAKKAKQTIVLSHDPRFLKMLTKQPRPINNPKTVKIVSTTEKNSTIVPCNLQQECIDRYSHNLSIVEKFISDGSTSPSEIQSIRTAIRVVVEGGIKRQFPMAIPENNSLESIISSIENDTSGIFDEIKPAVDSIKRLKDFSNKGPHSTPSTDCDIDDSSELRTYCIEAIRYANGKWRCDYCL